MDIRRFRLVFCPGNYIFGVFKSNFESYERYLDFETGVLHRISSRIYRAEWFGPGSQFEKTACFGFSYQIIMFIHSWPRLPHKGISLITFITRRNRLFIFIAVVSTVSLICHDRREHVYVISTFGMTLLRRNM